MKASKFKDLITSKTGLSSEEYDEFFNALEQRYGVSDSQIAGMIPDEVSGISIDKIAGIALPNTSKDDVDVTAYDRDIANRLGIDSDIVAKITHYGEELSNTVENAGKIPIVGGAIRDAVEQYDLGSYLGDQSSIGQNVSSMMESYDKAHGLEIPVKEESSFNFSEWFSDVREFISEKWDAFKDKIRGVGEDVEEATSGIRETVSGVVDHLKEARQEFMESNGLDYMNEMRGFAVRGVGDKIEILDLDEISSSQGKVGKVIATVPCTEDSHDEFISRLAEKTENVDADNIFGRLQIRHIASDIADDLAPEPESKFSFRDWVENMRDNLATTEEHDYQTEYGAKGDDEGATLGDDDGGFDFDD